MTYPSHYRRGEYNLPTRTPPRARPSPTRSATSAASSPAAGRSSCRGSRTSRSAGRTRAADVAAQVRRGAGGERGRLHALERGGRLHAAGAPRAARRRRCPISPAPSSRRRIPPIRLCAPLSCGAWPPRARSSCKTEIPGPRSREILERKERVVADPLSSTCPIVAAEGRGATLTDVDGNTFIDFAGGVGCLNVGHAHPRVVEAVQEQAARFLHTDFTIVPYEVYVDARRAAARASRRSAGPRRRRSSTPAPRRSRTPSSSRARTRSGPAVIAFEGAFHGRTLLSLTLTSKTHPYKDGPRPVRARGLPRAVPERVPRRHAQPTRSPRSSARSRPQVARRAGRGDRPRAGAGRGRLRRPAPPEFVRGVREICDRAGDRPRRRRGADRLRPHRPDVRDRALRRRARPDARSRSRSPPGCRSRACSARRRSWTRPATAPSAARTSATRSPRRRRSPSSTSSRRRASSTRAERIGETIRGRMLGMAGALSADRRRPRPRRDARDRARPGPGDEGAGAGARVARSPRRPPQRGLLLLKAGIHSNCIRVLCPLVIADAGARRGARRLGRGARSRSRVAAAAASAFYFRGSPRLRSTVPDDEVIAGRYELVELVGTGGMSSVYKAHDRLLERNVALKILHPHYGDDEEYVERFRREARAVAQMSHPNIVTVIDRGEDDGQQFIVFEYVDGENLKQLVERTGPLPARRAVELGLRDGRRARVRARARARAPRREAAERPARRRTARRR